MNFIRNILYSTPENEITPERLYLNRKQFMKAASIIALAGMAGDLLVPSGLTAQESIHYKGSLKYSSGEPKTDYQSITHYNNYYEFSTDKEEVADASRHFQTFPWELRVEGLVESPSIFPIQALIDHFPLEERIYRLRCVEGWSMVIPWIGFPLGDLLRKIRPKKAGRFVEFETLYDPNHMPGQKRGLLEWPYREGLRMDEAMHPLTILAVGLYGKRLLPQNGAPVRLVVPWKYGFKSVKSIVRIRVTDKMPSTAWNLAAPDEYGFYANVNPYVDHPRWSQATERRVGEFLKRKTLLFNGYEKEVSSLYRGMDLRQNF